MPGTYNAIPAPCQRPNVIAPAHEADVASPVTIQWDRCTDSSVTSTYVVVVDPATGARIADSQLSAAATSSQPFRLKEGACQMELAFE